MFYSTVFVTATALAGLVSAQNYSTSGPLSITPSSVDYNQRLAWCRAQTNSCPQICGGLASPNTCDPNSLNYTCTCTNGQSPNISNYDQTIPSFVCATWKADCVNAHPNDLNGQTGCHSVTCGSLNASSGEPTGVSSSTTASATASSTGSSGGSSASASASATSASGSSTASASSASASSKSSSAAVALSVAQNYGTGILATGLLAIFGLAL